MSPKETMKWLMNWMKEWNEGAEHQEHLKYMEQKEAEREERNRKSEAEREERDKECEADLKEYMERSRRKSEARYQEHLKEMDEIQNGPPIPYPITSCTIPSPPVQEVTSLRVFPSFLIIECTIASLPIQKIVSLNAHGPYEVTEVRILSPPVSLDRPSHESHLITSNPRMKPISDLSFFWDSEVEDKNEIASPSKVSTSSASPDLKSELKLSFFWESEEMNEITMKSAPEIAKLTTLKPKPIITLKVPSPPIQHVTTVHAVTSNCIIESQISSPPVHHASSERTFPPIPIDTTITSPPPTELVYIMFTTKNVITSLRNAPSPQSPSHEKRKC